MKYEDLSFTIINEDGEEVVNDIVKVIPNDKNSEEPYVVYTDYSLNEYDEFINNYAKLKQNKEGFYLETNLLEEEVQYINSLVDDEIVKYVSDVIEETIHE